MCGSIITLSVSTSCNMSFTTSMLSAAPSSTRASRSSSGSMKPLPSLSKNRKARRRCSSFAILCKWSETAKNSPYSSAPLPFVSTWIPPRLIKDVQCIQFNKRNAVYKSTSHNSIIYPPLSTKTSQRFSSDITDQLDLLSNWIHYQLLNSTINECGTTSFKLDEENTLVWDKDNYQLSQKMVVWWNCPILPEACQ